MDVEQSLFVKHNCLGIDLGKCVYHEHKEEINNTTKNHSAVTDLMKEVSTIQPDCSIRNYEPIDCSI